jgi:hypothetical protein
MSVNPALGKWRQEDPEFKASLGCVGRPYSHPPKNKRCLVQVTGDPGLDRIGTVLSGDPAGSPDTGVL